MTTDIHCRKTKEWTNRLKKIPTLQEEIELDESQHQLQCLHSVLSVGLCFVLCFVNSSSTRRPHK